MRRNTADKILDTATVLFAALGFENVTIKQLAQAANINSAAISYYFGGKENLYQEVLKSQFFPALQALREMETGFRLTATERLLDYVKIMMAVQYKQPYLTALWQYEMNHHDAGQSSFIVKEYTVQLYQYIFDALAHGISQKEFPSGLELCHTASVLLEMMHAPYVTVSLLPEQPLSGTDARKEYRLKAVRYYLQGIRRVPLLRNISRPPNRAKKRGGL